MNFEARALKLANHDEQKPLIIKDGQITYGSKRFKSHANTIRRQIIELIETNISGHLLKSDVERELISGYFIQSANRSLRLVSEPYRKRQNNVDKALSRLRQDLSEFFKDDFPEGTAWLCFSKKIDGWLLYRLPGLGCDGDYHW
jgi:ribosome maturation protein Sdo1